MAQRFDLPRVTPVTGAGAPYAGGKLYFYAAGTSTPQNTYSDNALTTPNANPVVADSDGRFGDIFMAVADYKVILKTAADVTVWTADPVAGTGAEAAATETTAGISTEATQAEVNAGTVTGEFISPAKLTAASTVAHSLQAALPRSYLAGLSLANNGTDPTNDIDIAVGACRDDANAANIVLASALTKRLDANWVVGTNQGMLDTGAVGNGTYHLWAIRRSDTGVVDILASLSASAPAMPASYDQKRRIGPILRESAAIVPFVQDGDLFQRKTTVGDLAVGNPGTSAVTRTLSVPTGINVRARVQTGINSTTTGLSHIYVYLSDLAATDEAPAVGLADASTGDDAGTGLMNGAGNKEVRTNTSAQVRSRISTSDASLTFYIRTLGWIDTRGRDG